VRFEIKHRTEYRYAVPAIEAYLEARLLAPDTAAQTVERREMVIDPELPTSHYVDAFGNGVEFFSMTLRHERLVIENKMVVATRPVELPAEALGVRVAEARQLFASNLIDHFDYLQPSTAVPLGGPALLWARRHLGAARLLGEALVELNEAIYREFDYESGSTDNATLLATVWKQKRGVCQDFAHVMLAVLRSAGLPCRYVCGYIETDAPRVRGRLVGSVATHAWVEVLVPGMTWVALDPTNHQWCGERHVAVSFGRDSRDAAPVRGTFKGSGTQDMRVRVRMKRLRGGGNL
jgi:transglutaminase-like putative cysteine protease